MENQRRNILLTKNFPAVKATRKRVDSTHPGTDGCFFVCCLLSFCYLNWGSKYILYLRRRNLNEKLWKQEMWRVIKDWSIEQMITRCFDQGEDADSQNKNNVSQNCLVHRRDSYARQSVPETIRETAVPRTAECEKGAADRADYRSRWSDCQLTADALRLQ